MGEIVNLRKARKRRARADKAAAAETNRARFGRTKAERNETDARNERTTRHVDGHRLEPASDTSTDGEGS